MNNKELAINKLNNSDNSLVIVKNNEVVYKSKKESVGSIVGLLEDNPKILENAVVADKIIGRAVAMICDVSSVNYCYGKIVSKGAIDIFEKRNLKYNAEIIVEAIKNRDNTDLCPIEKLTMNVNKSEEGIKRIKKFLKK